MKNENELKLSRTEFLAEFAAGVCMVSGFLYEIVSHASNYTVLLSDNTEILKCDAYKYNYEIDQNLGCYRFRYKFSGPWTKWIGVEGT